MPTFANQQVFVTPQTLTTTLTLHEVLAELVARPPQGATHSAGWRGITDDLERPTVTDNAGAHLPELLAADPAEKAPERVAARLISWQKLPQDGAAPGAPEQWFMEGVDVLISKSKGKYLVLWSTHDSRLIDDTAKATTGFAVSALLSAIQGTDPSADISSVSPVSFAREAYLWLTNAVETQKSIGKGVTVADVAGMGTDEATGRRRQSGKLDGRIGLDRMSFISAIGSGAELGPAEVTFTEFDSDGRVERTTARLNTSGEFKILLSRCHYRAPLSGAFQRVRVAQRLAYRYLPLVREGYKKDTDWGDTERDRLIVEQQIFLSKDFRRRAQANPQYAAWVADGNDIDAPL